MSSFDLLLPNRRLTSLDAIHIAQRAEGLGWRGLWSSEVLGLDAIVLAGALSVTTERLRLGTAIVPITTRSPAVLGMAASTIAQMAPGRFHLGIGLSTPVIVAQRHARPVTSPLEEAGNTVDIVRRALRGERVDNDGLPQVKGLRIDAPEVPPPVHLAALGPKMTDLAIDRADGLMLNLIPPEETKSRAAQARARGGDAFETFLLMRTCVDPTGEDLASLRKELTNYTRVPVYGKQFERSGYDVRAVVEAEDIDAAMTAMPDELVEALSVTGSAADCRKQLQDFVDAGVTPLVLPVGDRGALDRTVEGLGGE
jgi:probable F420-dependent oxidoreductase